MKVHRPSRRGLCVLCGITIKCALCINSVVTSLPVWQCVLYSEGEKRKVPSNCSQTHRLREWKTKLLRSWHVCCSPTMKAAAAVPELLAQCEQADVHNTYTTQQRCM